MRTGTKLTIGAVAFLLVTAFFRANVLPLVLDPDKLTIVDIQTPKIMIAVLIAAVIIFWGNEGRKTVENIFVKRDITKDVIK